MQNKYDVIVIGAGIGGLTAAAILARNGKKVLVLEKNPVAGGYAVNFRRGDFNFDASLHMLDGCDQGGLTYKILEKSGVLNKITLLKPPTLYRSISPDFDIRVPQSNIKGYIDLLIRCFPSEGKGIEDLFKEMASLFSDIRKFIYSKTPFGLFDVIFCPLLYPKLFKYSNKTYQYLLDRYLKDARLKTIIAQLWPYYGLPPSKLAAFYYAYPTYDYLCNGGYYPKGGVQSLTDAFLFVINENGGKIKLGIEATRIITKDNIAQAVETDTSEQFLGDIIISDIDVRKTFLHLIGEKYLPIRFTSKIKKLQHSISIFQVYLGLNKDLKELGILDYEILCLPSYDMDKQFEACTKFNIRNTLFALTLYSNLDPDTAPKGKFIMGITILSDYDYWTTLTEAQYKEHKERIATELIQASERIIPNLSSYIERMEIATPLTMERYTGNYKGAVYGWSQITRQSGIKRFNNKTPFKNLYLSSAWTRIGGGIFPVMYAGEQAAGAVLRTQGLQDH